MTEWHISKRAAFPRGTQKRFLRMVRKKLNISWGEMAQILNISPRTLADWKREKFTMPLAVVKLLSHKTKAPIPSSVRIKERFWYVALGGRLGGVAMFRKYGKVGGNPEIRKKKWREWWEREGRHKPHPIINISKSIKKPRPSKKLAEFVGIVLGDGGISERQLTITLHYKDDREYTKFVTELIQGLFGVRPSIYLDIKDSVNSIVVSRTELIRFCIKKLGLKKGNKIKQRIDIPAWIKKNKQFKIACVRGLVDTDGSVFTHTYQVNKKWYHYKKLAFTSRSAPLLNSVYSILKELGMNPRLARQTDVCLDSKKDMQRYFLIVGSHNEKRLKRYKK